MAHRPRAAQRRRQLDANPSLVADALDQPLGHARGVVAALTRQPPNPGRVRLARAADHELRTAVATLGGHRSPQERARARAVLRDLGAFIRDGLRLYPHIAMTPPGLYGWPNWQTHLKNLARQHPKWRAAIREDVARLERVERELAAEREAGSRFAVAMPREVVTLLEDITGHAPTFPMAERAELHRRVQRLIFGGGFGDYPPDHVSYRVLDALRPPDLYDLPVLGSA